MKTITLLSIAAALFYSTCLKAVNDRPIMGWSSWNTYRININDSLIRTQAKAIITTGLKEYGYNYINIDDGFLDIETVWELCILTLNVFLTEWYLWLVSSTI